MRQLLLFYIAIFITVCTVAQPVFRTNVADRSLVVGEAFQVQYIIETVEQTNNFKQPAFPGFRIVAGPDMYMGTVSNHKKISTTKNFVFTLSPLVPGKLMVPAASIFIQGKEYTSNEVAVKVISREEWAKQAAKNLPPRSDYFLRPGEDVHQKIKENLFLKVWVDRRVCYVGEPVEATYKLYSRLESKSDVVKNPGFYGFTVQDIINLSDRFVTTETINGKLFDVHTIRKVQLYPLQEGIFTVDAMELKNRIEFSRSSVNKKTEQEIEEGVLGYKSNVNDIANREVIDNSISTEPISITVKPLPEKHKPVKFDGAVGSFSMVVQLEGNLIANQQAIVEVVVAGKGNFKQLSAPVINWPAGLEAFEPTQKDALNITKIPIEGERKFYFAFVPSHAGNYSVPPIRFSFFNPDSGTYKTIISEPIILAVQKENDNGSDDDSITNQMPAFKSQALNWIIAVAILILATVIFVWAYKKKYAPKILRTDKQEISRLSFDEILESLEVSPNSSDFYATLQSAIWKFFKQYYPIAGTNMNKTYLLTQLKVNKVDGKLVAALEDLLQHCETAIFTTVDSEADKQIVWNKATDTLQAISKQLL